MVNCIYIKISNKILLANASVTIIYSYSLPSIGSEQINDSVEKPYTFLGFL